MIKCWSCGHIGNSPSLGTAFVIESYICANCQIFISCQGCDVVFNGFEEHYGPLYHRCDAEYEKENSKDKGINI